LRRANQAMSIVNGNDLRLTFDEVRGLLSREPSAGSDHCPQAIKVFTLGRFRILKEGQPICFSEKIQRKPLALLKAVIAFGGKDVPEDRLIDALWPDADGDSARQALSTTIHRLRRLIGYEQTLQRQGGKLSLDQRCWTDVWIFERLLAGSESAISHRQKDKRRWTEILESTEKALALYQGSFLSGDDEVPWAVAFGERLRRQWIRRLGELGERCESPRECQKAVDCYEKAAEIQPERKNFTAALWSSTAASGVGPRLSKLTGAAARSRSRNSAVRLP